MPDGLPEPPRSKLASGHVGRLRKRPARSRYKITSNPGARTIRSARAGRRGVGDYFPRVTVGVVEIDGVHIGSWVSRSLNPFSAQPIASTIPAAIARRRQTTAVFARGVAPRHSYPVRMVPAKANVRPSSAVVREPAYTFVC
jgi:hypothetical protein